MTNLSKVENSQLKKESSYVIFNNEKISYKDFLSFAIENFGFKKEIEDDIKKYYDKNTNKINKKIDHVLENYSHRITKFFSEIITQNKS